ncbi:MAG: hypothetical protein AAF551_08440 [Bacteroidota bacterium]
MPTLSKKSTKTSCTIASILLLIIGLFHGSGINFINGLVQESDVSQLVKNVFPVLFISPSIQLIGIGVIGLFAVNENVNYKILFTLSVLVLMDVIFAFWLDALIPGIVLLIPSAIYLVAAWSSKNA